jgi:hypothetical protein
VTVKDRRRVVIVATVFVLAGDRASGRVPETPDKRIADCDRAAHNVNA